MSIEKLIMEIMEEAIKAGEPVTKEEAREMAQMEMNSKKNRRYEQADVTKTKKTKERKKDVIKEQILREAQLTLERMGATSCSMKNEVELTFNYQDAQYTLKLIKHRKQR